MGYAIVSDDVILFILVMKRMEVSTDIKIMEMVVIATNIEEMLMTIIVGKNMMIVDMKVTIHQILIQERCKIMEGVI